VALFVHTHDLLFSLFFVLFRLFSNYSFYKKIAAG